MRYQGYWADLKAPDFQDLPEDTIAILPLGATEQHGPHLPLSVDATLVDAVLGRSLPQWSTQISALILPTLAITKSNEHAGHPGTLSVSARTLMATLEDIGASVAAAGVRRLVMLNGHGGNTAVLEIACRELRVTHNMIAAHASWFGFAEAQEVLTPEAIQHDLHAGDIETSAMLAVDASKVDMTAAADHAPKGRNWQVDLDWIGLNGQAARPAWTIDDLSPSGVCGDASAATPEKGEALLSAAARNFAGFLIEFSNFDPAQ